MNGPGAQETGPAAPGERSWVGRVTRLLERLQRPAHPRVRVALYVLITLAFGVAAVFAIRHFPKSHRPTNKGLLALDVVLGPITVIWLNAVQFTLIAALVSQRVTKARAMRVSVLGTAANQLPIPGAVLVRTQALAGGSGYRRALVGNIAVGLAWMGTAFVMAGLLQLGGDIPWAGVAGVIAGTGLVIACHRIVRRTVPASGPRLMTARILVNVSVLTIVQGFRLFIVLRAFGVSVSPAQAIALALSNVLVVALQVTNALGVREVIAAGIGPLVGLPASVSLLASAFDRIADLVVLGIATLLVFVATRREDRLSTSGELPTDPERA